MKFFHPSAIIFSVLIIVHINNSYSFSEHSPLLEDSTKAYLTEGIRELDAQNYGKAVALISKYIMYHNLDEIAFLRRGDAYYFANMYEEALSDYKQADKIGYKNPEASFKTGITHLALKQYDEAEAELLKTLAINEKYPLLYEKLGDVEMYRMQPEKSIDYYEKAEANDKTKNLILSKVNDIYISQERYEAALKYLNAAIQKKPDNPDYFFLSGTVYFMQQDTANAESNFIKSVTVNPSYVPGYTALARIYTSKRKYAEAISNYSKAIDNSRTSPSQNVLYTERGNVFAVTGANDSAIKDFEHAISLSSLDTMAYIGRGEIFVKQGKDSLALIDLNKGLALNTSVFKGLVYRGKILFEMGQYENAQKDLTKAVELSPKDTLALFLLGNTLLEQEKFQEAIRYYDKALSSSPSFTIVYENRGVAYYNLGYYRQAMSDFDNAMKHNAELIPKLKPLYDDAKMRSGM